MKRLSFLGLAACLLWASLICTSCNGGASDAGAAPIPADAGIDPATGKPAEGMKGGKAVENSPGNIPQGMKAPPGVQTGISH